jgi:Mn2+/Fe2+ NRAMP family transporter
MVSIQLASARIGRITGKGLTENFTRLYPRPVVVTLVGLLVLANVINLGADLNAMGDSAAGLAGGPKAIYTVALGAGSLLLQVFLPYERYVRVLKWLTLSLLAYVGVCVAAQVDWLQALRSTVVPSFHWQRDYAMSLVAILGTTISPYLFFWQAAQEVEEIKRVKPDKPLRIAPVQAQRQLRRLHIDTALGMGFSNAIAFCMIVAAAATLHAHGVTDIQTTTQAAQALQPIAGRFAFLMFALGIIGTGLLALPVLAGSAAYAVASLLKVHRGLNAQPSSAKAFYAILSVAMLVGLAVGVSGLNPIKSLYWSAVVNAVISVPVMAAVMAAASHPKIVGEMRLPFRWRILGWLAAAFMAAATLAMFASILA